VLSTVARKRLPSGLTGTHHAECMHTQGSIASFGRDSLDRSIGIAIAGA
jgi:hypothetical protein